jgi:hypothetical protein
VAPARTGQLDEISQAIGRVDAYVHEYRHGIKNVTQMINGLDVASEKRHATLKIELSGEIDRGLTALRVEVTGVRNDIQAIAARVATLEAAHQRQTGARNVLGWALQSPLVGWVAAGLIAFLTWWRGLRVQCRAGCGDGAHCHYG